jgi:holo-[acyl-carrier protein] synthase
MPELRNPDLCRRLETMASELTKQRLGVDAIHLPSWERYLEVGGEAFLHRVYTDAELDHCERVPERLAVRFAAKEAVLKVLGTGISGVGLRAVEVVNEASGRPVIRLRGGARGIADTLSLSEFEISLCHEQDYALAVATARQEGLDR